MESTPKPAPATDRATDQGPGQGANPPSPLAACRLSTPDLTRRILEMAQTGVYRESLFDTFRPLATRRQIRTAIALAKQYGLYTVASLRDDTLGTYYQADSSSRDRFQAAARHRTQWDSPTDAATQVLAAQQTIRAMLTLMATATVALGLGGAWQLLAGHAETGRLLWLGGLGVGGLWAVQRLIAKGQGGPPP